MAYLRENLTLNFVLSFVGCVTTVTMHMHSAAGRALHSFSVNTVILKI